MTDVTFAPAAKLRGSVIAPPDKLADGAAVAAATK